jgi:formimidoylglutamate deiminase
MSRLPPEMPCMINQPDRQGAPAATFVLPGMPNLHSHAFQRAMSGLAERRGPGNDSFWSWRETMYAFAAKVGPEALQAVAAQLYVEMLKAGYTHVCEFQYLHHQPDGRPYADSAQMSLALVEAAREAGIGLTLLPVLYMTGGFDGRPLSVRQRRFGHEVDAYLRLLERLHALRGPMLEVGVALHSLRAVPPQAIDAVSSATITAAMPIHIHIAEQTAEVDECVAVRGAPPVAWLLDHAPVDARWCLVHATHLTTAETAALARSGAVAGLCPTTEANLGDGLFPLAPFVDADGTLGIGSDSHVSVSPVEELRWLEYGQRLLTRQRNIVTRHEGERAGERLWRAALQGGERASGLDGRRADWLVLDDASPLLAARSSAEALDSFIFAGNTPLVRDVLVDGRYCVRDGQHADEQRIAARFRRSVSLLREG